MKVIMPRKIVPHRCCLPSLNITMKKNFDIDNLLTYATHFQVLSVMFIEQGVRF